MTQIKSSWIINSFALLHAITSMLCRAWNVSDTLFLTLLTMTMTVIICIKNKLTVEFTAINVVLVNIIGYVLGVGLAKLIALLMGTTILTWAFSTFVTTEVMGWSLVAIIAISNDPDRSSDSYGLPWKSQMKWILIVVASILALRIFIGLIFSTQLFSETNVLQATVEFLSNMVVLLIMCCVTILFMHYIKRLKPALGSLGKGLAIATFLIIVAVLSSMLVGYGLPFGFNSDFTFKHFLELLVIALLLQVTIYSIIYLLDYALSARKTMETERGEANLAKFQYLNLKQQVNPHFLFNSLNVLDCLVTDGKNAEASTYIHKLAGIYRYMLKNENEAVVRLKDEMDYVNMYTELMLVRFPHGLEVKNLIREEDINRFVVPFSVELLIENATKHNAISADRPLIVNIISDGEQLTVTNNLNPKVTKTDSTGKGINYIRQHYLDFGGKDIKVEKTEKYFIVSLPLM